jgi:hypothetical protein
MIDLPSNQVNLSKLELKQGIAKGMILEFFKS